MLGQVRAIGRDLWAFAYRTLRRTGLLHLRSGGRILFIDDLVPDPAFGAGFPRAHEIVKCLVADGWRITLYPLDSGRRKTERVAAMLPSVRFLCGEGERGLRRLLRTEGSDFSAIIVSRPKPMATYLAAADERSKPIVIYDAEALLASREAVRRCMLGMSWSPEEHERAIAQEIALASRASAIIAVTSEEAEQFRSRLGVPVIVASHCVREPVSRNPFNDRRDLLFVGRLTGESNTSPNVDSIVWFVQEVIPLLEGLIEGRFRLHLVGLLNSSEITDLLCDRVVAYGVVDNLDSFFDRCRVVIAPTRFSAGLPLKVVEAMARGVPCATTPPLKKQLGQTVEIAQHISAESFAEEVRRLYEESDAWQLERERGLMQAATSYSHKVFNDALRDALDAVGASLKRSAVS